MKKKDDEEEKFDLAVYVISLTIRFWAIVVILVVVIYLLTE